MSYWGVSTPLPLHKTMTTVPNRYHNSGKPPKRKLKPRALKSRKQSLAHLKKKLQWVKS